MFLRFVYETLQNLLGSLETTFRLGMLSDILGNPTSPPPPSPAPTFEVADLVSNFTDYALTGYSRDTVTAQFSSYIQRDVVDFQA